MINAYMTDLITRHIAGVLDEWSERGIWGTEEIDAHVVHQTKLVYNSNGEEVSSPIQILISPDQAMDHRDRIQLDGESFTHPVINIYKRRHLSVEFQEVYLEPGVSLRT